MTSMQILEALERKEITAKKAAALLVENSKPLVLKKGQIMKVKIKDGEHHFSVPLPLFLVYGGYVMGKAALKLGSYFNKRDGKVGTISNALEGISDADMKVLIDSLSECRSEGFVEVHDGENHVIITIN